MTAASRPMSGEEIFEARINLAMTLLEEVEARYQAIGAAPFDEQRRKNAEFAGFASGRSLRVLAVLRGGDDPILRRQFQQPQGEAA